MLQKHSLACCMDTLCRFSMDDTHSTCMLGLHAYTRIMVAMIGNFCWLLLFKRCSGSQQMHALLAVTACLPPQQSQLFSAMLALPLSCTALCHAVIHCSALWCGVLCCAALWCAGWQIPVCHRAASWW